MKINQMSNEMVGNLQKLIGGQITSIFVEGGRISKGENMILDGGGMISIIVRKKENGQETPLK